MKVLLASGNRGKLIELQNIFLDSPIELVSCADAGVSLPNTEETGDTYLDNARLKAKALAKASGFPALADDSGLEVDALGGAPGVHSARYAGTKASDADNISKLLAQMPGITRRTARFRCVLVLAWPDGRLVSADGVLDGTIGQGPRGKNGFGYDPVFVLADGRHAAELTATEKDSISHRAVAAQNLKTSLRLAGIT